MLLKLTNTITHKLEVFQPLDNKNVRIYVCGPTVYDRPHIGNGRAIVVYDVLYRILQEIFGANHVTYVRNITDIDDKIIIRANELGISIKELTSTITQGFNEDSIYLNCLSPNHEPKATETIHEMINIIEKLLKNGHAYYVDGHVYFSTDSYADYGKLAGKDLASLIFGSRFEVDNNKRHPSDFVLWKPETSENDGASYDSKWGKGRPGWHIECSAMSHKFLGSDFDIHGGGADLMFPHHTNEIAQSCCAFEGSKFARYWVHNGFLTVNGEKMSKSLGNFITIEDLKKKNVKGEVVRLLLLNSHYRLPLDYNEKTLHDSKEIMDYFYRALGDYEPKDNVEFHDMPKEFVEALLCDLNIHLAVTVMLELAKNVNKTQGEEKAKFRKILFSCGKLLGFFKESYNEWFGQNDEIAEEVEDFIKQRKIAKEQKNWPEADRIRKFLLDKNIILEDNPDCSTTWRMR